jgi:hypothetical protein
MLVFGGYLLLAIALTYPVAFHLTTTSRLRTRSRGGCRAMETPGTLSGCYGLRSILLLSWVMLPCSAMPVLPQVLISDISACSFSLLISLPFCSAYGVDRFLPTF